MVKTIEETYCDKDLYTHIIDLPDSYIGSIERAEANCWICEGNKIVNKGIQYIPGLYKIYDEIIVNAYDQYTRLSLMKNVKDPVTMIKVSIDRQNNTISVYNNGEGIPVDIHKKTKMYVPEMIFGMLLTSSNYSKDEKKLTGGKNGFGSKLTNIFSTEFIIETVDAERKKKYIQTFRKNMLEKDKPKITKCSTKPYTKITFKPDLSKFNLKELEQDIVGLMERRVYDIAACTGNSVSVYLNEKKIDCKSLDKYVNYFFDEKVKKVYAVNNNTNRWEVCVVVNPQVRFEQMSFVNGIHTVNGGKHVDSVVKNICRKIQNYVKKKGYKRKKNIKITQENIKDNMFVFVRSMIENPSFKGQIKEFLTTGPSDFGSKFDIKDDDIEKLVKKTPLVERAIKISNMKKEMGLVNFDESKGKASYLRIPKLDDANFAGSQESLKCTLILTEGDSAKTLAVSGLDVVGRDYFGVYPLKGKPLNVRGEKREKILKNKEITELLKVLGLTYGMLTKYKDINKKLDLLKNKLRYGRIMIFADQDVDGIHIKGLVMNIFHTLFPETLLLEDFIISLATPIIKITKGKTKSKEFYTESEYEKWLEDNSLKGWNKKYYKGLGTSTSKEGKEYFKDFESKKIVYGQTEDKEIEDDNGNKKIVNESNEAILSAFDGDYVNKRKEMIKNYDRTQIIEQTQKKVLYEEYVNKELVHHMNYNCERAIPSICDGLKLSQRKILYAGIKRNLKKEIKVSQFAGYVSEHSGYHHGEKSLNEAIKGMAQNYVGSNNLELFVPNGQFGTRLQGGKDSASERYIFTCMHPITQLIYHSDDYPLMNYLEDDGMSVEPEYYIPILPMILVNGSCGIATGYSSSLPNHNPLDVISNIRNLMDGKELKVMKPWYRGFDGDIDLKGTNKDGLKLYRNKGIYKVVSDTDVNICELPIGKWTENYKDYLETLIYDKGANDKLKKNQCLVSVKNNSSETKVNFTIKFKKTILKNLIKKNKLEDILKLKDEKNTSYSNIHLYSSKGVIKKYESPEDILNEFYEIRLEYYVKRKEHKLRILKRELDIIQMKIKFINDFISEDVVVIEMEDEDIYEQLEEREYIKFPKNPKELDYDENDISYDYLLDMRIRTLTKKRIEELKKQEEMRQTEYKSLLDKEVKDIWKEDLDNFQEMYEKYLKEYLEIMNNTEKPKKSKGKTRKKRVRKIKMKLK